MTPKKNFITHKEATIRRINQEEVVLIIQDTSEIDYTHRDRIEGMGPLSFDCQQGFYLHPSIAVTPERICVGVVDRYMWARKALGRRFKHKGKPIEGKESHRWIEGYQVADAIAVRCPNTLIVDVADREGDIYELFMQSGDKNAARWLVRSTQNRQLLKDETQKDPLRDKLWEKAKKRQG